MPFSSINLPNYNILSKVYESENSVVYRGQRRKDDCAIILKILKGDYPSLAALARYRQAYEITHSLNLTSVVKAYALEKYQNTLVMVLEDFGGQSLKQLLMGREFSLAELLTIFIQIINSLGEIHAASIIHKDINPSNIIYNLLTQQLKIIDFGISSILPRETPVLKNPSQLEGTLHYMSPEQTGRMNRTIDYRTDFYALGVTFYEMLTHRLPFENTDTMGLVHCHLAKQPPLPHFINAKVPVMLSTITLKLMEKVAEARYQSTFGIKADLENCLAQLQSQGKIESFPLGQQDISDKFQLPQKLYGRVQEKQILLQTFDKISQGHSEILMISGYSGIGKTTLVQEIYRPLTCQVGYFIAGKFEQLQRNIPYSAVISALTELVKQLLTESEEQLQHWREQLLTALGANTQVIVEVIPEIEFIVGKQPTVTELPLTQARNRFNLVFQNFIEIFTRPEHPLVMFLDNLQWADTASLKLLKLLSTATGRHHLFIIGAYRDNEVGTTHPLSQMLTEIQETGTAIQHIQLSPLTFYDVSQLIAETFNTTPDTVSPLAEVVLAKNQGNPLFIKEFLQLLYNEKLIYFVPLVTHHSQLNTTGMIGGNWEWNLVQIQAREVTNNVVELLADRIKKLSVDAQRLLQLAACIGNQFSLQMVAVVLQKSPKEIVDSIQEAVFESLLLPLDNGQLAITQYQLSVLQDGITSLSADCSLISEYKFAHERIRQAAYFLIADEPKQIIHQQVGNLLLQETSSEQLGKRIFDIVNQFNLALPLIESQTERNELAKLNLLAGQKAKASAAFEPALRYTLLGLELLGESAWQQQYDLALQLTVRASELAYLVGDFEKTDSLVDIVLKKAKTLHDKLKVYEIRMQAYKAQSKSHEAIELGLSVLALLGIKFPKTPNKLDFLLGLTVTKIALLGKSIKSLGNLPSMTNPDMLAAMRIMLSISPAVYEITPKLLPLIVFKRILLSIKYGNTYESIPAYASYGYILCAVEEDIENGYQFGQLALQLLEQVNVKELQARVLQIVHGIITPYKEHISVTLKPLLEGYQSGLETGNFEYATMSVSTYITHSYFVGKELAAVENEIVTYTEAFTRLNQRNSLAINQMYRQVILNLREPQPKHFPPLQLLGEACNEEIMLPLHQQAKARSLIFQVYLQKLVLCCLFQAFPEAYQNALFAAQYLDAVIGSPIVPLFHFYDSLAHLALFSEDSKVGKSSILQRVAKNQQKMQKWAHHAPVNYLHKFYLVEAEQAHVLHQDGTARELYDRAIVLAQQNEYVNEEALACELAGKFYLAKKQTKIAQVYLWDAHHGYSRWGAFAKVKDLETRYPRILSQSNLQKTTACPLVLSDKSHPECQTCLLDSTTGHSTVNTPKQSSPNILDLTSILKVSQVIAGEIKLKNLLEKLMKVVVENAGAQTGFLLLNRADTWVIEAKATISTLFTLDTQNEWRVETLQSTILTDSEELSTGIVHYVARTKEYVILNDAAKMGHFTNDSHILKRQPKSVLCAPLINQGHITAIFYLENNLATGVFTPNRIEMLNLLSSQMAIAIENARLYASLEEKVRERTKDIEAKNIKLLELNEKLIKLNQDKDEFLGIAAHDLKNPLAAIQGLADMIEMDFDDMSKEEIIDLANMIQISSKQMFELIMNLLNVNSIESGKIQLSLYKLDILPVLRWIINQYTERAKAKNIRLGFQYAQEIYYILGDEGTLRQILDNLVSNAVKYSLHDKNIFVRLSKNQQWVRCEVQDEGPGLNEVDRRKLFGKFTRLTPQPTGDENSTGLGLFIVKKLVEALNGEVWCESELGRGSTFIVEFPRFDSV